MEEIIQFSEDAKEVIDLIENSKTCLFVIGKAGTGKSILLNHICEKFKDKMTVLTPTEIAALNVKGETIQPNELRVRVKAGALVVFINNDAQRRWVNGTIGKVISQKEKN